MAATVVTSSTQRNAVGDLPDCLILGSNASVFRKKESSQDGVADVEVSRGGKLQGEISVYLKGVERAGLSPNNRLPIPVEALVGAEGANLLALLSKSRKADMGFHVAISPSILHAHILNEERPSVSILLDSGKSPDEQSLYAGVGTSLKGLRWFPQIESFRRHCLIWKSDRTPTILDFKIPGEKHSHYNIHPRNFTSAVGIYNLLNPAQRDLMAAPVALVQIPHEYTRGMYDEEERLKDADDTAFTPRYMIIEHLNGRRLVEMGKGTSEYPPTDIRYVQAVAGKNGMDVKQVLEEAVTMPFAFAALAHEFGYRLGGDCHFGNFVLCPDGHTRFTTDLGDARKIQVSGEAVDVKSEDVLRLMLDTIKFSHHHRKHIDLPDTLVKAKKAYAHDPKIWEKAEKTYLDYW
ncbi:MAG: hypothetical protein KKD39_08320 [Candidatus Altiarchaeota archaeon]|nr:hypothetical protein [Candidatus Altiarchaeota archaeon]